MVDISTELCGIKLRNPVILASGILDTTASSLVHAVENGAGAVTCKSISLEPREGHKSPIIIARRRGMLNAVGLSNPGIKVACEEIKDARKRTDALIIGNIFADNPSDFGKAAKLISGSGCGIIELNLSCPNVEDEFGKPFACDSDKGAEVVRSVKKNTKLPVFVKLAPNVPNIGEIAKAVEKAGADGITAINTMPGMMIDVMSGKPILTNKSGGYSGYNLKPIAVKCVYDIYRTVKIPIIGTGGVTNGEDAVEMLMAGASAVGIGTAVYYRGIDCFRKINDEIKEFMEKEGYQSVKRLVGKAHEDM